MATGWYVFGALLAAYFLFLTWLVRTGRMEKWNLDLLLGFILMIRTQHGRGALAAMARPKRFWNAFGDVGIALTLVGMFGMAALMISIVPIVLNPANSGVALNANEILVIPGVNPFVPLWYGIIALIITLVVHEGGHGVLAIANKMRVKSVGLLYAIVPIGAFVEPDEDDLMESPRRARLRVYAAGPTVNIAVAAITLAVFASMIGGVAAVPGAPLASIVGNAAHDAGLEPTDIIVSANGEELADWQAFIAFMDTQAPGDSADFGLHDGSTVTATFTSRWQAYDENEQQYLLANDPAAAEEATNDAYLGVATMPIPIDDVLAQPFGNGGLNFVYYASLPLTEVRGQPYLSTYLPAFFETPFSEEVFWPVANLMFWVFWINLMVGLTNILPMLPLDGGHLFRDVTAGAMERIRPNMEPDARNRVVGKIAGGVSLVIFGAFLLQIFGPWISRGFA